MLAKGPEFRHSRSASGSSPQQTANYSTTSSATTTSESAY
jgi:hypothetical protein